MLSHLSRIGILVTDEVSAANIFMIEVQTVLFEDQTLSVDGGNVNDIPP
jgi:hypothetical protein